jgi:hypothetical protein
MTRPPSSSLWLSAPLLSALVLVWAGQAWAGRSPDPDEARACVGELIRHVREGSLHEERIDEFFSLPEGPLADSPEGLLLDQERLLAMLRADGPLGEILGAAPEIRTVVQGPDYARVVLDTQPLLSLVLVREAGRVRIQRWETTGCAECREPVRFVVDLIEDVQQGLEPRLIPGYDLHVASSQPPSSQQGRWNQALTQRNNTAGYLRWLLADAEVLGQEMAGVRVSFRDRVEVWPVTYEGGWGIAYDQLEPSSSLILTESEQLVWRDDAHVRQAGREWWLPTAVPTPDGGRIWAEYGVSVAWQPVEERWLVGLGRPDRLVSGLYALEPDGAVSERFELPHWPDGFPVPVGGWYHLWESSLAPSGDELLVACAHRWWLVGLRGQGIARNPAGVLNRITASAWSTDGRWLALGDEHGNLGLAPAGDPKPSTLRYLDTAGRGRQQVSGLVFLPGSASLLVAWEDGVVARLGVPSLEPLDEPVTLCCGGISALALRHGHGEALLSCGGGCPPLALTRLPLVGEVAPSHYADEQLSVEGAVLSVSPDGAWAVIGHEEPGRTAALCRASDLVPVAGFSDIPLQQVAWRGGSDALLALRKDGSVVHWTLAAIMENGALEGAAP